MPKIVSMLAAIISIFAWQNTRCSGQWLNRFANNAKLIPRLHFGRFFGTTELANACIRAHITSRRRAPGWGAVFDPRQDIAPTPGTSLSRTQNSEGLTEGDEVSFEIEDIMRGSQTSR
jgi:hypothetical protein